MNSGETDPHDHYFTRAPTAATTPRSVTLALTDMTLELATDSGVFSSTRVDPGTSVLLTEAPHPPPTGAILDLGCGYGPIALALARRAPRARVWAIDVNERALDLTRMNAESASIGNVTVSDPDDVPPGLMFKAIYSNPPIRIGKAALQELLLAWLDRLESDGRAVLVVQKHLGSDSLARWLRDQGFPTRRLTSKHTYRVLEVGPR